MLFLGFLPVEYDDLTLVEVEPNARFLERSSMFSQKLWEHERVIETFENGVELTDRIHFEPRVRLLDPIYRVVFHLVFRFRHHRLRRLFEGEVI